MRFQAAATAPAARVLTDLQHQLHDLPEIFIAARRAPAPYPDVDLSRPGALLDTAEERALQRRFTGAPITGFGAL